MSTNNYTLAFWYLENIMFALQLFSGITYICDLEFFVLVE